MCGAQDGLAMHSLLGLACVLALSVYSQQDSGGLASIWTAECATAWGDIQLEEASSPHMDHKVLSCFCFLITCHEHTGMYNISFILFALSRMTERAKCLIFF